jgi:opacity protein-like surface antigen
MKKLIIALALLAAAGSNALADDLPAKVMKDSPGVTGAGATVDPTAKPDSGSLSEKAMKDAPGVTGGGTTVAPTAKPDSGSLSEKAMKDAPGVSK